VVVLGNPGNLVKVGSVFLGWSASSSASLAAFTAGLTFTIYDDVVLFVVWVSVEYTVTFAPGVHGVFAAKVTGGLRYGDVTPAAPAVTGEAGWIFNGWLPVVSATVTGDVTYVAQWTQTVASTASPSPSPSVSSPATSPPSTVASTASPSASSTVSPLVSASVPPAVTGTPTTPRVPVTNKWAVVNLILSIIGIILAVLVTVRALLLKKKNDDDDVKKLKNANVKPTSANAVNGQMRSDDGVEKFTERRTLWLVAVLVLAVVNIVVFLVTEAMSLPRTLVDRWTIVNAVILVVEVVAVLFVFKQVKTKNDEQTQAPSSVLLKKHPLNKQPFFFFSLVFQVFL
jgi:hypothetical protein